MIPDTLILTELTGRSDPLLLPWLDLYETAFPPTERVLVSRILSALEQIEQGRGNGRRLACSTDSAGRLTSLLDTYEPPALEAGFLWYLAVIPALRGQGLGARLYRRAFEQMRPAVKALFFDVEDPREMKTPQDVECAVRRIAFYRRLGARLIGGIRYIQTVGDHQPPITLRLMAHPGAEMSAREAIALASPILGGAITLEEEPYWE